MDRGFVLSFLAGELLLALGVVGLVTGRVLTRSRAFGLDPVARMESPLMYWIYVVVWLGGGASLVLVAFIHAHV